MSSSLSFVVGFCVVVGFLVAFGVLVGLVVFVGFLVASGFLVGAGVAFFTPSTASSEYRHSRVRVPITPSTVSLLAFWKAFTAEVVPLPYRPVILPSK